MGYTSIIRNANGSEFGSELLDVFYGSMLLEQLGDQLVAMKKEEWAWTAGSRSRTG